MPDGAYWQMLADLANVNVDYFQCWCVEHPELTGTVPTPEKKT